MDSRPATYAHIQTVQRLLGVVVRNLTRRSEVHDQSKLQSPELEIFDEFTPKLAGSTYGSDEYKQFLAEMKPALDHHYAANSHHPEHYPNGIQGMNLLDVLEMLVDWKAATMRHNDGDIRKSIEINQKRFGFSDELKTILLNTLPAIEAKRLDASKYPPDMQQAFGEVTKGLNDMEIAEVLEWWEARHKPGFFEAISKNTRVAIDTLINNGLADAPPPEHSELAGVTAETVFRLVRKLANQDPTRYWLDAKGDGSYSHVAIAVYSEDNREHPDFETAMAENGFTFTGSKWRGRWFEARFEARRLFENGRAM